MDDVIWGPSPSDGDRPHRMGTVPIGWALCRTVGHRTGYPHNPLVVDVQTTD